MRRLLQRPEGPRRSIIARETRQILTGRQLRRARLRAGLTQGALADRLGVARNTVWRIESGHRGLTRPLARLAEYVLAPATEPSPQKKP